MLPPDIVIELFGTTYTFNIFAVIDPYMPTVRNIISFILWAKFIFSKYKALPAIIGQVPVISAPENPYVEVDMYRNKYGR